MSFKSHQLCYVLLKQSRETCEVNKCNHERQPIVLVVGNEEIWTSCTALVLREEMDLLPAYVK